MIPRGLFTQLMMIVLAIGIVVFYIQPTFEEIGQMQDDISLYQTERQKVTSVNDQLATLINRLEGIPSEDQGKLLTYMPDEVDAIATPKILQTIAEQSGVQFEDVQYGEVLFENIDNAEEQMIPNYPVPHSFNFSIQGTYQQIKTFLGLMETNEFPLEVHDLEMGVLDGGFMTANITVVTYSHNLPAESPFGS